MPDRLRLVDIFLENTWSDFLDDVLLNIRQTLWFMRDAHFRMTVCLFLDTTYGNYWIGKEQPVEWPARSPDLNPCDFY